MDMINRVTARTWREGHGTTPQGWPLSPPAGMATSPAGTTPWPRVCAPSSPHLVLTFVLLRSLASHHRPPPQAHTSKPRASDPQPRYTGIQVYRYTGIRSFASRNRPLPQVDVPTPRTAAQWCSPVTRAKRRRQTAGAACTPPTTIAPPGDPAPPPYCNL